MGGRSACLDDFAELWLQIRGHAFKRVIKWDVVLFVVFRVGHFCNKRARTCSGLATKSSERIDSDFKPAKLKQFKHESNKRAVVASAI